MNLFELGQALKQARLRQSLTQHELAELTGVSLSTISGLERGTLLEIGVVKLVQLLAAVRLELQTVSIGQRRTLDDVHAENMKRVHASQTKKAKASDENLPQRQRVRHAKKRLKNDTAA